MLKTLAMIADANNDKVKQAISGEKMFEEIYAEASIPDLPKDEIQDIFNEFVQKKN